MKKMFIEVNREPRTAIEVSFSAWGGLGKQNRSRGETFFPDSGSDRDSDETFFTKSRSRTRRVLLSSRFTALREANVIVDFAAAFSF